MHYVILVILGLFAAIVLSGVGDRVWLSIIATFICFYWCLKLGEEAEKFVPNKIKKEISDHITINDYSFTARYLLLYMGSVSNFVIREPFLKIVIISCSISILLIFGFASVLDVTQVPLTSEGLLRAYPVDADTYQG